MMKDVLVQDSNTHQTVEEDLQCEAESASNQWHQQIRGQAEKLRAQLSSMLGQDVLERAYTRLCEGVETADMAQVSHDVRQILGVENEQCIHTLEKLMLIEYSIAER